MPLFKWKHAVSSTVEPAQGHDLQQQQGEQEISAGGKPAPTEHGSGGCLEHNTLYGHGSWQKSGLALLDHFVADFLHQVPLWLSVPVADQPDKCILYGNN